MIARINKISISIFLFSFLFLFAPSQVLASDLVFSPVSGSIVAGKPFTVNVSVSNNKQAINAVSGTVSFPSDLLTVTGVSKSGSIIGLWATEPSYSQGAGTVSFEGVILNPGFSGSTGKVISITFIPKKTGKANLLFSSGAILANDGQATNLLSKLGSASFVTDSESKVTTITTTNAVVENTLAPEAPKIESSTNPDPTKWYNNNSPVFSWDVPEQVTSVKASYGIGQTSVPTREYIPVISSRTLSKIDDGVYYMHVQYKNAHGLGPVSHYKFSIDTKPPQSFEIKFPEGNQSDNPRPTISFRATDSLSGIDHYEIKIDNKDLPLFIPETNTAIYTAPFLEAGEHTILVKAVDRAGNATEQSADFNVVSIESPKITDYTKELEEGQIFKVNGYSAYSNSKIVLTLKDKYDQIFEQSVSTDDQGKFDLIWTGNLIRGTYEVTAKVIDSRGAKSAESQPVVTIVNQRALFKVGALMLDYLGIGVIVLITLAALIGFGWFLYFRLITMRSRIKMGISKTELLLHKRLTGLKDELRDHLELLEKVKKSRSLTKEEATILRSLNRKIDAIEEDLDSSLKAIK